MTLNYSKLVSRITLCIILACNQLFSLKNMSLHFLCQCAQIHLIFFKLSHSVSFYTYHSLFPFCPISRVQIVSITSLLQTCQMATHMHTYVGGCECNIYIYIYIYMCVCVCVCVCVCTSVLFLQDIVFLQNEFPGKE